MVEISWISTDKNNFSRASYAINNYRLLVEQLERLNLSQMETNAQIAFWINMYNSMIMHCRLLTKSVAMDSQPNSLIYYLSSWNMIDPLLL
ncbi:hypothetical protein L6452_30635 [Arctium lappa]|uniref:Uncharacterized protein n=1 Tax=Arctium lappa TaxID=4217 RepID=A0ACB8ZJ29_ARCLA|nr:hypothetical protein L6452_30635 [Arctium lappa]